MKRTAVFFLSLVILVTLFIYLTLGAVTGDGGTNENLKVAFLDVGQGDATFITAPSGTQVLIDGGRGDGALLRALPDVLGAFDRTIDVVVATHPDADHIGGLIEVFRRYTVNHILMTNNMNDTPAYDAFMEAVANEGAMVTYAARGQVFDIGVGQAGSTTLSILFPDRDVSTLESNTASIIARLSYGTTDILLTGDAPDEIEEYLVTLNPVILESEVLKVGHHGSRTSTAPTFVTAVRPQYGIISAGKDNDYGHPHKEVLDTLKRYAVTTKNTADLGSIFLESDGQEIWFK